MNTKSFDTMVTGIRKDKCSDQASYYLRKTPAR